jgi:AcrR family transcriptional regulator
MAQVVRRTQAERTAATRAALLQATLDTLVEEGYRGTTTQKIAKRAGLSYGALLHHFPTKHDLLTAGLAHLLDERIAEFRKAMADLPPQTPTRDASIDVLWQMFQTPTFVAWIELYVAARTDTDLAPAVATVDRRFTDISIELFRELFPEESRQDPDLPQTAIGLLFSFLTGLAVSGLVPGCAAAEPTDLLNVFKLMISAVTPEEGTPS